ncbi:hypothetical protein [Shewanella sp. UCD-KL21]|uniref:hypothetical protein n=1 Tax=Shewanella sp. UCD-KL21 TaxID=1917164 RepID=UPI000970C3C5|nr:hypothetical protein [Shewanella sp. UCD-KL21]
MDIPVWQYFVSMTGYIVLLLVLVEGMRRTPRLTAAFWLLSLVTAPLWADQLDGWFRWVKTVSVLIPTALVVGGARIAWLYHQNPHKVLAFFRGDWVLKVLYAVLVLNIAEATLKDFVTGNYFNGICGVILCITIPFPRYKNGKRVYWVIGKDKPTDLLFYSTAAWNFLYTTWNLAFVFGENPAFFASSFCILMAAELYPIIKGRPELYLIARVYTLAFHILIRANSDIFTPLMDSSSWANDNVVYYWGVINLALHVPFAIWYFTMQKKNGEPPFGEKSPPPLVSELEDDQTAQDKKLATA